MRRLFLFTMMCLLGLFGTLNAQQVELQIGEGTDQSFVLPTNEFFNYSVSQQIYTAEEMQDTYGTITDIAIKQSTDGSYIREFAIYMMSTDKEYFSTSSDWVDVTSADLVFHGEVTYPGLSGGWLNITLQTPFVYEGGNILLCINDLTGEYYASSGFATYEAGDAPRSILAYRDTHAFDASALTSDTNIDGEFEGSGTFFNNQIEFTIVSPESPIEPLIVTPNIIDLGARPNGAWMRPAKFTMATRGEDLNITAIAASNSFFSLSDIECPFVLTHDPVEVEVEAGEGNGEIAGELIVLYSRDSKTFEMRAYAYDPVCPDVWEMAQEVESYPYSDTPAFASLYDNYMLPGMGADGRDAVYKLTFENDILLTAIITGER